MASLDSLRTCKARIVELESDIKWLTHQMKLLELENDRRLTEQSLKYINESFGNEENTSDVGVVTASDSSNVGTLQDEENEQTQDGIPSLPIIKVEYDDRLVTPEKSDSVTVDDSLNNAHLDISCPHT